MQLHAADLSLYHAVVAIECARMLCITCPARRRAVFAVLLRLNTHIYIFMLNNNDTSDFKK